MVEPFQRRRGGPLTLAQHLRGMVHQCVAALLALADHLNTAYAAVLEDCSSSGDLGLG